MKKLFACALFGVAMLWTSTAFACDYDRVEVRKVQKVVEVEEVEVRRVKEIREVKEVRKVVQPTVKVQVRSGIFGLRRTNVTIR